MTEKKWGAMLVIAAIAACLVFAVAGSLAATKPPSPGGGGVPNPANLQVSVNTVFSEELEWAAPSASIRGYKVAYCASPGTPVVGAAVDAGNVTSYWVTDLAPNTNYNFRVWAYDRKGTLSSGTTVAGSTLPLPINCLAYIAEPTETQMRHITYDPVNDRIYGVGAWIVEARHASDLTLVTEFGDGGVVTTRNEGYAISAATDSAGNIYVSGAASSVTYGMVIQKLDPGGNLIWSYEGAMDYECTEVRTNIELDDQGQPHEYVYGLGQAPLGGKPMTLVKLDVATSEPVPGFEFQPGNPGAIAGNPESLAIGSSGIYFPWHDQVLGSDVVSKYGFNGELLAEVNTGSAIGQGIATGFWQGQEWVWVGFPNQIRRYDVNLVEAPLSEAGIGCHLMDPSPYYDWLFTLRVVNDGTRTLLYAGGKTSAYFGADYAVFRFDMTTADHTVNESDPGGLFDTADHIFDWGNNDAPYSVVVDRNFDVIVAGRGGPLPGTTDLGIAPIFKFSGL